MPQDNLTTCFVNAADDFKIEDILFVSRAHPEAIHLQDTVRHFALTTRVRECWHIHARLRRHADEDIIPIEGRAREI